MLLYSQTWSLPPSCTGSAVMHGMPALCMLNGEVDAVGTNI